MLSVWINFRLDMCGLKMRALEWSMSKQQQQQFNRLNLCFFFGSSVLKEGTEKPHLVQVTISLTFN